MSPPTIRDATQAEIQAALDYIEKQKKKKPPPKFCKTCGGRLTRAEYRAKLFCSKDCEITDLRKLLKSSQDDVARLERIREELEGELASRNVSR